MRYLFCLQAKRQLEDFMITADSNQLWSTRRNAAPFGELGFDLQSVKELAACSTLVRTTIRNPYAPSLSRIAPVAAPAGFELLLLLGRETRGR